MLTCGSVRVLVTGFGPFPGIPQNASASLVLALEKSAALLPGLSIAAAIFPVVWSEARAAAREAAARFKPDAILHFGVSKRVSGFEIETRAFNISGPKEDHAGATRPESQLVAAGKPVLMATLPPFHLLDRLKRGGFPAAVSDDAGRYLCNALFYWSLSDAGTEGPLVSFVHIPALGTAGKVEPRITMEEAVAGARILVRASAEAVLRAKENGLSQGGGNSHGSQTLYGDGRNGGRSFGGNSGG